LEINAMDRQCTGGRIENKEKLISELSAWSEQRNKDNININWGFTKKDADLKLSHHYVS
jgi:hypothetical protein